MGKNEGQQQAAPAPSAPSPNDLLQRMDALAERQDELELANDDLKRQNAELKKQLAAVGDKGSHPAPAGVAGVPAPAPYRGWVQAKQDCHINGAYRCGPDPSINDNIGDVFEVDTPCLYTDDPYEPVEILGYTEVSKRPLTRPNANAPKPVPFRFRHQAMQDNMMRPLRVDEAH